MSLSLSIEALLQATRTLSHSQAEKLRMAGIETDWAKYNAVTDRLTYIAEWFDYLEDWYPQLSEAVDDTLEREQICYTDEPFNTAFHMIRDAYQALIYERYLKPEEFELATEPTLSILS